MTSKEERRCIISVEKFILSGLLRLSLSFFFFFLFFFQSLLLTMLSFTLDSMCVP